MLRINGLLKSFTILRFPPNPDVLSMFSHMLHTRTLVFIEFIPVYSIKKVQMSSNELVSSAVFSGITETMVFVA